MRQRRQLVFPRNNGFRAVYRENALTILREQCDVGLRYKLRNLKKQQNKTILQKPSYHHHYYFRTTSLRFRVACRPSSGPISDYSVIVVMVRGENCGAEAGRSEIGISFCSSEQRRTIIERRSVPKPPYSSGICRPDTRVAATP
jgi:hypothetical protein